MPTEITGAVHLRRALLAERGGEIVDVANAPEREAGEVIEDDGEGHLKIVEFLDKLKVI